MIAPAYVRITTKQISETVNDSLIPAMSETQAWSGVSNAPPSIAMIKPDAPILVSAGSMPSNAIPYIVGNMSDMVAEIAVKQITPVIPDVEMAPTVNMIAKIDAKKSSRDGATYFISHVNMKRNNVNANMEYRNIMDASFSKQSSSTITYRIVNDHTHVCTPT